MPKKERVYVSPPDEEEEVPEMVEEEAETPLPEVEAPMEVPVDEKCGNCGLPRKDFEATWDALLPGIQRKTSRADCPKCGSPLVKQY